MAFLLRTICHSADGREIVRTATDRGRPAHDRPRPAIATSTSTTSRSRSTMRRVELVSGGQLGVSAETGLTGRAQRPQDVGFGHIEPATGRRHPDRQPFLLRFLPTAGRGRTTSSIDVERAPRAMAQARQESTCGCSRSPRCMPGKRPMAWAARRCSSSPSSSPGRSGPSTRAAARRRATPRAIMPTGCGRRAACRRPMPALERQLQGLPRQAVRGGARRAPARPATPASTTMPIRSGWQRAHARPRRLAPARSWPSRRSFGQPPGPLRRMPYRA